MSFKIGVVTDEISQNLIEAVEITGLTTSQSVAVYVLKYVGLYGQDMCPFARLKRRRRGLSGSRLMICRNC